VGTIAGKKLGWERAGKGKPSIKIRKEREVPGGKTTTTGRKREGGKKREIGS